MKFFRIILIAVILISTVYPCVDGESISFTENISLNIPSEDMHRESEDNCSPFCTCACCSISYSIEFHNSLDQSVPSENSSVFNRNNYFFTPFLPIWQPPRA